MKAELCKAFCDELTIHEVPVGFAVGTGFRGIGGDLVGFYVIHDRLRGFRIADDGSTLAFLTASGFDLSTTSRREALTELLNQDGFRFDEASGELTSSFMTEDEVPGTALRFVGMMVRVPDLLLLAADRVASTFEEDARNRIKAALHGKAQIRENEPIATGLREFRADMIIQAGQRTPVAVFFSRSEVRVYEAIFCQLSALYEKHITCAVIALLEKPTTISRPLLSRAANRLTAVTEYEGDEDTAVSRIVREVIGGMPQPTMH